MQNVALNEPTTIEPISKGKLFIVLARGRTGSSLLISWLQSHPGIVAGEEILANLKGRSQWEILRDAFTAEPGNPEVKARGFKLFYRHPFDADPKELFEALSRIPTLHVIRLQRRNHLRSLVSLKIAHAQDLWHVRSPGQRVPLECKRTRMTVPELKHKLAEIEDEEAMFGQYFHRQPLHTVYYEDMVSEPLKTFESICTFLGVENCEPSTDLIRQNPEPLSELVENFTELRKSFVGTKWAKMFEG